MKNKHEVFWRATRAEWVSLNPPNHQGYYVCWICSGWVKAEEMELDHVKSRSRAPDLRYVLENLRPSHHQCNTEKGSGDVKRQPDLEETPDDLEGLW